MKRIQKTTRQKVKEILISGIGKDKKVMRIGTYIRSFRSREKSAKIWVYDFFWGMEQDSQEKHITEKAFNMKFDGNKKKCGYCLFPRLDGFRQESLWTTNRIFKVIKSEFLTLSYISPSCWVVHGQETTVTHIWCILQWALKTTGWELAAIILPQSIGVETIDMYMDSKIYWHLSKYYL